MNIDRFIPVLPRTGLLLVAFASSLLLSACGGSDNKTNTSSSASLSSARSSYTAASVPANGSGDWPSVKVSAAATKTLKFEWSTAPNTTYYKLMKNNGGNSGYQQVGNNIPSTGANQSALDEIGVHVHDWINTRYLVEACNADGCSNSNETYTASAMLGTVGYLKASNAELGDFFGWSLALSADGMTLAVGAPAEDSNALSANGDQTSNTSINAGAVYIFVKENGNWVQEAYLKASNTEQPNLNSARMLPNDRFGYRVALSDDGNSLAVSALLEDSPSTGINCNQNNRETTYAGDATTTEDDLITAVSYNMGAVYVFKRNNAQWTQDAYIKPQFFGQELRFGETLSISGDGNTLAVGTTTDSNYQNGILTFDNSSSVACEEFYPSSAASSTSSSSSSSSVAPSSSDASSSLAGGTASGGVYIYHYNGTEWQSQAYIKASNAQIDDSFGASLALSTNGDTLAVGAIGEDSNATGINGDQSINACYYLATEIPSIDPDPSCSTALKYNYRGFINNGAAYVFSRSNNAWSQEAYIKPANTYLNTYFGNSIDLSGDGNTLAIGAIGDASNATGINGSTNDSSLSNSGAAYVFSRSGTTWAQQAYIKPNISRTALQFGQAVSLAQDGKTLAVGTYFDSSIATGVNGDQGDTSAENAGTVFVFTANNGQWMQKSYVKATNTNTNDRFGLNVDLSGNGSTMAVGAHREAGKGGTTPDQTDNSADAAGAVYLY